MNHWWQKSKKDGLLCSVNDSCPDGRTSFWTGCVPGSLSWAAKDKKIQSWYCQTPKTGWWELHPQEKNNPAAWPPLFLQRRWKLIWKDCGSHWWWADLLQRHKSQPGHGQRWKRNPWCVGCTHQESVILTDLKDIPKGVAMLLALLYALNIDYPQQLKYTFKLIQKVFMNIGGGQCSSVVHGVKNKLLHQRM